MFDLTKAIDYVKSDGSAITQAKLAHILDGAKPTYAITQKLFEGQRPDGGFSPFWAPDYSSIDATCYRLAQAESMGLDYTNSGFSNGLRFLLTVQQPSGRLNEDPRMAEAAPPWAKPGSTETDLYITANAAFWLAQSPNLPDAAADSAAYIHRFLKADTGQLPSFLNTYWLAAGLWWTIGERETAVSVLNHLQTKIAEMDAANLIWLLNTLRIAQVPKTQTPIPSAIVRLKKMQEENGRFPSNEGQEIQLTLDALHVLKYFD